MKTAKTSALQNIEDAVCARSKSLPQKTRTTIETGNKPNQTSYLFPKSTHNHLHTPRWTLLYPKTLFRRDEHKVSRHGGSTQKTFNKSRSQQGIRIRVKFWKDQVSPNEIGVNISISISHVFLLVFNFFLRVLCYCGVKLIKGCV